MNQSVENLAACWASIEALCAGLTDEEWRRPTGCPGWSVQDQLSHLIDYEARALGRPAPDHPADEVDTSHTKNDLGAANEVGIDYRRRFSGPEVLAEFREVTAGRAAQLRALGEDDLAREINLPIGRGTVADMLVLRVMDTWSHEQDIRRAVGRPGHDVGPVASQAIGYFAQFLPLVVARRASPADGDAVAFEIGDQPPMAVAVSDGGKGSWVDGGPAALDGGPTVALRMSGPVFAALVGGRSDVDAGSVETTGDADLGRRVIDSLAFLP